MAELGFINDYFFCDNNLKKVTSEGVVLDDGLSVYEVVKIISGVPLFYESHIQRLSNSLKISDISYLITSKEFSQKVKELCQVNKMHFGNIELRVVCGATTRCYLGFVPHKYPAPFDYLNGVVTSLINLERSKPNAKVKHTSVRIKANNFIDKNKVFEVLLVDNDSFITEGSRSNMFYIIGNVAYTAPYEKVLPGITRKHIIEALGNLNITFKEKLLSVDDLKLVDVAFLCGTSPGIMPITNIDNYTFNVKNKLLRSIMLEFNSIIKQYVIANQNLH